MLSRPDSIAAGHLSASSGCSFSIRRASPASAASRGTLVRIRYLQHVPFEGPAYIEDWAAARGHFLAATRLFAAEPLPSLDAFDTLVILGGPMSVHDAAHHSWLTSEKRLIEQAIRHRKRVLGICLGAQLIADVLGARVTRNAHKEIGWHPVEFIDADSPLREVLAGRHTVFHWHGETFAIPAGAVRIARSEACENQAFVYDAHVIAIQFHLEFTEDSIRRLAEHCADELVDGPFIQSEAEMLAQRDRVAPANTLLHRMLDRFHEMREPK
jgi:GMP synthase-like glutamine amidotransferase